MKKTFTTLNYEWEPRMLLPKIKELIQEGVDPTQGLNYCLRYCTYNNQIECLDYLINKIKIPCTFTNNYLINYANRNKHTEVFKLLRKNEMVIITSYQLKQKFHTEEEIAELKKNKPYLFI